MVSWLMMMMVMLACRCDDMVKSYSVTYVPGGATQNTIRIAQVVVSSIVRTIIVTYICSPTSNTAWPSILSSLAPIC